jgi:transcriptional regulator with XRE-family HTH domain
MVAQREPYEFPAIRAFAAELTAWREEAGMSKTELAESLGYTPQLLGQIEAVKNIPSKQFAEDADTFFKTNGLYVRLWKLITDTRHLVILPAGFPDFLEHEAQASMMYVFEPSVIKGIFQTREYAYEIVKAGRGPDEIEQLVTKRMERQQLFERAKPPRVVAVLDEMAMRRVIGGHEIMRGQLRRLAEVAEMPNITLQIVPASMGSYGGLMGAFDILGFEDRPEVVYIDGHIGGQLITDGSVVREYRLRWDLIRGAALSADESLKLLHKILESYEHAGMAQEQP